MFMSSYNYNYPIVYVGISLLLISRLKKKSISCVCSKLLWPVFFDLSLIYSCMNSIIDNNIDISLCKINMEKSYNLLEETFMDILDR